MGVGFIQTQLIFMRNSNSKSSNSNSRKSGFTMVELMVVVVILSVLASIVFALSGRVRATAHRTECVSILRQYGVATTGYLSDNNNMMPAIGVNLQKPFYRHEGDWHIFAKLFPYFGLERQRTSTALPDNLVCPAFRHHFPEWNSNGTGTVAGNAYFLNQDQAIKGRRIYGTQSGQKPAYGSMSYAAVVRGTGRTPISKIIYLTDGHHPSESSEPVHGNKRNYLFLDFHVESLPVGQLESTISP